MNVLQEALQRKKRKEILRREHKQKQDLYEIKDIFVDAFSLLDSLSDKPIIDKIF